MALEFSVRMDEDAYRFQTQALSPNFCPAQVRQKRRPGPAKTRPLIGFRDGYLTVVVEEAGLAVAVVAATVVAVVWGVVVVWLVLRVRPLLRELLWT